MYVFVLSDTKNGEQRAVICNSIARRAVEYQQKFQAKHGQSDYVFPSRHLGNMNGKVRAAGKVWNQAWIKAGLPSGKMVKQGIHNCRHTFAHRRCSASTGARREGHAAPGNDRSKGCRLMSVANSGVARPAPRLALGHR
jgi:integrase